MRQADFYWRTSTRAIALVLAIMPAVARSQVVASPTVTPDEAAATLDAEPGQEIVVTGSRIDIGGFDAPTPTTVVGAAELRIGNRASIGQVLNDLPQFRASTTPQSTVANTNSGTTTADLRGLGSVRTLTLLNGRRSIGTADLNVVPLPLVERVEVVTGGASAAYGSGAVAGVVNILLDRDAKGLTIDAQAGISSRGDAARYSADISYGTDFADDRGHIAIGGSFTKELGAFNRDSRRNIGSTAIYANPNYTPFNDCGRAPAAGPALDRELLALSERVAGLAVKVAQILGLDDI